MDTLNALRWAIAAAAWALLPAAVQAVPFQYDLVFQTTGQSIWDTGASSTLNKTTFLGAAWQDQNVGVDLIAGDENSNLPNPLRTAYDVAFAACTGLGYSSSTCINGQSAQAPVPALGSRPTIRSCGRFAVACKIAQAADYTKRAAYDTAFSACRGLGFSSSVCRNGQSAQAPVPALGTAPPQYLAVDTRTGVGVEGTVDGRVGVDVGLAIDSGSVDATVSYRAALDIPDTTALNLGDPINFNPSSILAGTNTLNTTFANLELSVDAVMQLSGNVSAEACVIPAGCTTGGTPFDIDEIAPIVSFNQDHNGGVLLLGQPPSNFGFPDAANGFPFAIDVANLVEVTLHLPRPDASGGLNAAKDKLEASGQDDLVDIIVDLDNVVATSAGVPGLFGSSLDVGALGSVGFDIINVEMGPTIDLVQDFELEPTLFVQLDFDQPVLIGGAPMMSLVSAWDALPDIVFTADTTTVTPTFFVDAQLQNNTLLDFDLNFAIDLLQIYYDFGLLGNDMFGIGNVLDKGIDLFQSPAFYSNLFPLNGFNLQLGDSFVIDFLSGSTLPASSLALSAVNEIVPPSVPEPGTILLLMTSLCGVYVLHRRRRRSDNHFSPSVGAEPSTVA